MAKWSNDFISGFKKGQMATQVDNIANLLQL